ncbi:MAG: hypothetical protein OQK32_07700 [Gammaproteobacteria bacterium]|nr:hypothetical protein [Gammaproteobacteria bacterium]MCW8923610.1 hypothetical protein [Gammaproteobacteria bacterium]
MKKQIKDLFFLLITLSILAGVSGCTGFSVQGNSSRSGETVSIAVGYRPDLTQDNITIGITDYAGTTTTYLANDPAIQLVYNMYPDPISAFLVSGETGLIIDGSYPGFSEMTEIGFTNNSKDFFQTLVFFNLPQGMEPGIAHIQVYKDGAPLIPLDLSGLPKLEVEVVAGEGDSQNWLYEGGGLFPGLLESFQRVSRYRVVTFSGSTIPHSIQLTLNHDPDIDNGGAGRAFITTPRGDIIRANVYDDGLKMNVILSPVQVDKTQPNIENFKFYVAGDITGWQIEPDSVKAFDINGEPVAGVVADLVLHN